MVPRKHLPFCVRTDGYACHVLAYDTTKVSAGKMAPESIRAFDLLRAIFRPGNVRNKHEQAGLLRCFKFTGKKSRVELHIQQSIFHSSNDRALRPRLGDRFVTLCP